MLSGQKVLQLLLTLDIYKWSPFTHANRAAARVYHTRWRLNLAERTPVARDVRNSLGPKHRHPGCSGEETPDTRPRLTLISSLLPFSFLPFGPPFDTTLANPTEAAVPFVWAHTIDTWAAIEGDLEQLAVPAFWKAFLCCKATRHTRLECCCWATATAIAIGIGPRRRRHGRELADHHHSVRRWRMRYALHVSPARTS
jgi:hypothetical protein